MEYNNNAVPVISLLIKLSFSFGPLLAFTFGILVVAEQIKTAIMSAARA